MAILIAGVKYDTGYNAFSPLFITAMAKSMIDRIINAPVKINLLKFTNPYGTFRLILFLI